MTPRENEAQVPTNQNDSNKFIKRSFEHNVVQLNSVDLKIRKKMVSHPRTIGMKRVVIKLIVARIDGK
jgi:hypothetical protein